MGELSCDEPALEISNRMPRLQHVQHFGRRGRLVLAAATATVVGALILFFSLNGSRVSVSASANASSSAAIPVAIAKYAAGRGVTDVGRFGPADSSKLGWFSGRDAAGNEVVAVAVSDSISPFVPLGKVLKGQKLVAYSGDSGATLNSVDSREVVGLVASDVARVDAVLQDGSRIRIPLIDRAFVYSAIAPAPFPLRVVGYDATGAEVGSKDFLEPSPPGTGAK